MVSFRRIGRSARLVIWVALPWIPAVLIAGERKGKPLPKGEVVEVFSGIEKGQLEVQLIPKDSTQCRLLVKNKTDQPLSVQLPPAFSGVPVLAQWGQGVNGVGANNANVPQALGIGSGQGINGFMNPGGFRNPGGFMNPGGFRNPGFMNLGGPQPARRNRGPGFGDPMPNFMFNVPPEKVVKLRLKSVCLDYGKPNPRPKFKYEIKPLESCSKKAGMAELCSMLGRGKLGQQVAQLAAWHLQNDLSWDELAKVRQKVTFGTRPRYDRQQLRAAQQAAEEAVELAKKHRRSDNGKADSLSRR